MLNVDHPGSDDDDDDDDDDDVYYPKGRKPREDEEGEESYEKQRRRPGGRGLADVRILGTHKNDRSRKSLFLRRIGADEK